MKYMVYCHEINRKKYIGFTEKGLLERLRRHINLSNNGSNTYFHRAIRKYGVSEIVSTILFQGSDRDTALEKERYYINLFSSNDERYGYNLTKGGDGGDCVSSLTGDKRASWKAKLRSNSTGQNNSNYSGVSDEKLISEAVKFFVRNKTLGDNEWKEFSRQKGYPRSFSKNRFNGSFKYFVECVKKELVRQNIQFNDGDFCNDHKTYSETSRKKISKAISGRKWYNDGSKEYQIFPDNDVIKTFKLKPGRLK